MLDDCNPSLVDFLIEHGTVPDVHSASRLALMPKLRELISVDPTLVHARGGDGQTPLEKGADIDARDIDHESTPLNTCCVSTRGVTILMIAKAWLAI